MTQDEAFKHFITYNTDKLDFIPNIKELRKNFDGEIKGLCCSRRRALMQKYKSLIGNALSEANQ